MRFLKKLLGGLLKTLLTVVLLVVGVLTAFGIKACSEAYPNERRVAAVSRGFLSGAYHVHSTASDGRGTPEEIAEAARAAGLSFVVLTDHNVPPGPPRFVDGVLLIQAVELSTPHGHLVALSLPRGLTEEERNTHPIEVANALGADLFLAHPVQQRNPWRQWEPLPEVAGLELYSADTMLREALAAPATRLVPAAGAYLTNTTHALYSLVAEQPEAAQRLLQLGDRTPPVALCAHDAHGLPAYEEVFRALAMYLPTPEGFVLPRDPVAAQRWVLDSLASGRGVCSFRALGDPEGFRIEGLEEGSRTVPAGTVLRVVPPRNTPDSVRLQLTGNGEAVDKWTFRTSRPGVVHVELWRRAPGRFLGSEWKPWIVPSPIGVR